MTRALTVTCLSLAMAVAGALGAAPADAKPTIAVLGLEVTADSGNVDQQTTAAAANLTLALRDRARSGTGPFDSQPGSDKELIDLKLLNDCASEGVQCMVKIGNDLGARVMLYGKLAKSGGNYRVSMTMLSIDKRSKGDVRSYDIPVADLAAGAKGKDTLVWARKIYSEMTGDNTPGTVVVRVTGADRGTLLVEENGTFQVKGSITSGQARVSLPEGKYRIAVESEGFQRFESTVTVTSGSELPVPVTMTPMPKPDPGSGSGTTGGSGDDGHNYGGTVSEGGGHTGLKIGAWGTLALAAGAGGFWIYERVGPIADYTKTNGNIVNMDGTPVKPGTQWTDAQCGDKGSVPDIAQGDNRKFRAACSARTNEFIAGGVTVGLAVVSAGLFYLAYRGGDEHAPSGTQTSRKHRTKPTIALIPTMTPTGAGATFRLDW